MPSRPTKRLTIGTDLEFPVRIRDELGNPETGYKVDNALTCKLWRGDDQAVVASPAIAWRSTGQGLVNVKVSRTDTLGLEPGTYAIQGYVAEYDGDIKCIFDGDLVLTRAPGMATPERSYTDYDRMLARYGPLASIPLPEGGEEGWAEQAAAASRELEDAIVDAAADADRAKVRGWLDDGKLVVTDRVRRIATFKALAIALGNLPQPETVAAAGRKTKAQEFADLADAELAKLVAEIDTDGAGAIFEVDLRAETAVMSSATIRFGYLNVRGRCYPGEL